MSNWQPIETAPKDGTYVYLWVSGIARHWVSDTPYLPSAAAWDSDDQAWFDSDGGHVKEPTHWIPLFDAPQIERATNGDCGVVGG